MNNKYYNYSQLENNYTFNFKEYKSHIKSNSKFSFLFIFLTIIILLSACVFLRPKKSNLHEYYFVEIDNFQTYQNALNLSQTIKQSSGAGYIYFDGVYHVLASFYSKHDSAEKVVDNLKSEFKNVKVFTIKSKKFFKSSSLNNKQNACVKNYLEKLNEIIFHLDNICINFETKISSHKKSIVDAKNLMEQYNEIYNDFISNFKTNSKHNITKKYAKEICTSFTTITSCSEQDFSCVIRNETINIVVLKTQIEKCF